MKETKQKTLKNNTKDKPNKKNAIRVKRKFIKLSSKNKRSKEKGFNQIKKIQCCSDFKVVLRNVLNNNNESNSSAFVLLKNFFIDCFENPTQTKLLGKCLLETINLNDNELIVEDPVDEEVIKNNYRLSKLALLIMKLFKDTENELHQGIIINKNIKNDLNESHGNNEDIGVYILQIKQILREFFLKKLNNFKTLRIISSNTINNINTGFFGNDDISFKYCLFNSLSYLYYNFPLSDILYDFNSLYSQSLITIKENSLELLKELILLDIIHINKLKDCRKVFFEIILNGIKSKYLRCNIQSLLLFIVLTKKALDNDSDSSNLLYQDLKYLFEIDILDSVLKLAFQKVFIKVDQNNNNAVLVDNNIDSIIEYQIMFLDILSSLSELFLKEMLDILMSILKELTLNYNEEVEIKVKQKAIHLIFVLKRKLLSLRNEFQYEHEKYDIGSLERNRNNLNNNGAYQAQDESFNLSLITNNITTIDETILASITNMLKVFHLKLHKENMLVSNNKNYYFMIDSLLCNKINSNKYNNVDYCNILMKQLTQKYNESDELDKELIIKELEFILKDGDYQNIVNQGYEKDRMEIFDYLSNKINVLEFLINKENSLNYCYLSQSIKYYFEDCIFTEALETGMYLISSFIKANSNHEITLSLIDILLIDMIVSHIIQEANCDIEEKIFPKNSKEDSNLHENINHNLIKTEFKFYYNLLNNILIYSYNNSEIKENSNIYLLYTCLNLQISLFIINYSLINVIYQESISESNKSVDKISNSNTFSNNYSEISNTSHDNTNNNKIPSTKLETKLVSLDIFLAINDNIIFFIDNIVNNLLKNNFPCCIRNKAIFNLSILIKLLEETIIPNLVNSTFTDIINLSNYQSQSKKPSNNQLTSYSKQVFEKIEFYLNFIDSLFKKLIEVNIAVASCTIFKLSHGNDIDDYNNYLNKRRAVGLNKNIFMYFNSIISLINLTDSMNKELIKLMSNIPENNIKQTIDEVYIRIKMSKTTSLNIIMNYTFNIFNFVKVSKVIENISHKTISNNNIKTNIKMYEFYTKCLIDVEDKLSNFLNEKSNEEFCLSLYNIFKAKESNNSIISHNITNNTGINNISDFAFIKNSNYSVFNEHIKSNFNYFLLVNVVNIINKSLISCIENKMLANIKDNNNANIMEYDDFYTISQNKISYFLIKYLIKSLLEIYCNYRLNIELLALILEMILILIKNNNHFNLKNLISESSISVETIVKDIWYNSNRNTSKRKNNTKNYIDTSLFLLSEIFYLSIKEELITSYINIEQNYEDYRKSNINITENSYLIEVFNYYDTFIKSIINHITHKKNSSNDDNNANLTNTEILGSYIIITNALIKIYNFIHNKLKKLLVNRYSRTKDSTLISTIIQYFYSILYKNKILERIENQLILLLLKLPITLFNNSSVNNNVNKDTNVIYYYAMSIIKNILILEFNLTLNINNKCNSSLIDKLFNSSFNKKEASIIKLNSNIMLKFITNSYSLILNTFSYLEAYWYYKESSITYNEEIIKDSYSSHYTSLIKLNEILFYVFKYYELGNMNESERIHKQLCFNNKYGITTTNNCSDTEGIENFITLLYSLLKSRFNYLINIYSQIRIQNINISSQKVISLNINPNTDKPSLITISVSCLEKEISLIVNALKTVFQFCNLKFFEFNWKDIYFTLAKHNNTVISNFDFYFFKSVVLRRLNFKDSECIENLKEYVIDNSININGINKNSMNSLLMILEIESDFDSLLFSCNEDRYTEVNDSDKILLLNNIIGLYLVFSLLRNKTFVDLSQKSLFFYKLINKTPLQSFNYKPDMSKEILNDQEISSIRLELPNSVFKLLQDNCYSFANVNFNKVKEERDCFNIIQNNEILAYNIIEHIYWSILNNIDVNIISNKVYQDLCNRIKSIKSTEK